MEAKQKAKGSWGVRFFIVVLSIALGILFFWLLGFVERDIGDIDGPEFNEVRKKYVKEQADSEHAKLSKEADRAGRQIKNLNAQQQILKNSTSSLQNTIRQLLEIQKQSLENKVEFSAKSKETLLKSQSAFLENQEKHQDQNTKISDLTLKKQERETRLVELSVQIKQKEKEANKEFGKLLKKHRWHVAVLKLSFLVPILIVVSLVFLKYRTGTYRSVVWALFIAAFIKVAMVAHAYFPSQYFKYIALFVVIAIVLRIMVYLIKTIVSPKKDLLLKQYQQHYDKYICPVCSKPMRIGPLRYHTSKKNKAVIQVTDIDKQQAYTCPSCGTNLYDKCDKCQQVRHSLLPHCEHCGIEKAVAGE